jgi:hypothetical protein
MGEGSLFAVRDENDGVGREKRLPELPKLPKNRN